MKKETVILFRSGNAVEDKTRAAKIKNTGRKVEFKNNTHPDGTGPCGKVCSCKDTCINQGCYGGDGGAMTGTAY